MSTTRPKLFIGSSSEMLEFAEAIKQELDRVADVLVWTCLDQDAGKDALSALLAKASAFDFGVFVFGPDDVVTHRGVRCLVARDNTVFELGLFLGKLDRHNVFFFVPELDDGGKEPKFRFHIPSDLASIIHLRYRYKNELGCRAATGSGCATIANRIKQWRTRLADAENPLPCDATDALGERLVDDCLGPDRVKISYLGGFPIFFEQHIVPLVQRAKQSVRISCDFPTYGSFSANDSWRLYHEALLAKSKGGVNVSMVVLNEEKRKAFLTRQTASTPDEWATLVANETFFERLKRLKKRTRMRIDNPEKFVKVTTDTQKKVLKSMVRTLAYVGEVDTLMTIYLWIVDKSAIFSIPTFGKGRYAIEHGFLTSDDKVIAALESIWSRYREVATPLESEGPEKHLLQIHPEASFTLRVPSASV